MQIESDVRRSNNNIQRTFHWQSQVTAVSGSTGQQIVDLWHGTGRVGRCGQQVGLDRVQRRVAGMIDGLVGVGRVAGHQQHVVRAHLHVFGLNVIDGCTCCARILLLVLVVVPSQPGHCQSSTAGRENDEL